MPWRNGYSNVTKEHIQASPLMPRPHHAHTRPQTHSSSRRVMHMDDKDQEQPLVGPATDIADLEDFGSVEVTDKCCGAMTCRVLAPEIFHEAKLGSSFSDTHGSSTPDNFTYVGRKIRDETELRQVRRAVKACPFHALKLRRGKKGATVMDEDFNAAYPIQVDQSGAVYLLGHYSPKNAGATCYLIVRPNGGNVLIDCPLPNASLIERIKELGGAKYLVFTHIDHTAFTKEWKMAFPAIQRVLHAGDVVENRKHFFFPYTGDVEIKLAGGKAQPLDKEGDIVLIPIPGHSSGSLAILFQEHYLFTGDSLFYSRPRGHLVSSRLHCWSSWEEQRASLQALDSYQWAHVLPGHGEPKRFSGKEDAQASLARAIEWMGEQPGGSTSMASFVCWLQLRTHSGQSRFMRAIPRWARKGIERLVAPAGAPGARERARALKWARFAVMMLILLKVLPKVLAFLSRVEERRRIQARAAALVRLPWGHPWLEAEKRR